MIGLSEKGGGPKSVVMVDSSKLPGSTKEVLIKGVNKTESSDSLVDVVSTEEDKTTVTTTTTTTSTATSVTTSTKITESSTTTVVATTDSGVESQEDKVAQGKRSLESTTNSNSDETKDSNKRIKLDAEARSDSAICKLDQQPTDPYPDQEVNLFATEGWRDLLCQCTSCMTMYTKEGLASFILGEEAVYEADDDDEAESSTLESGMKKLGEMDRVQMMDGMMAYNRMRDEVRAFLEPYSQQGKVVTESDIHAFFAVREPGSFGDRLLSCCSVTGAVLTVHFFFLNVICRQRWSSGKTTFEAGERIQGDPHRTLSYAADPDCLTRSLHNI